MRNDIIEMAKLVVGNYEHAQYWPFFTEELEHFAKLVEKRKCEELAKKIEAMPFGTTGESFAVWIREQA